MPTPVPLIPQESSLSRFVVGSPVAARHGARWASQIAYLLGRAGAHRVASHTVQALSARSSATKTTRLYYLRSKVAAVAVVAIELREDNIVTLGGSVAIARGDRVSVTVTLPSGATWISKGPPEAQLDGTSLITLPSPFLAGRKFLYGLIDVSGVSSAVVSTMTIAIAPDAGATHLGLGTVSVHEVPLSSLKAESVDPGLLVSWPDPRNWLEEGDADGPRGLSSIVDLEQQIATTQRWWWQICGYEDAAPTTSGDTWFHTGAAGAVNWRGSLGAAYTPKFRTRTRAIYSGSMAVGARVRYLAASGGSVQVKVTPVGGSTSTITVTCAASGAWANGVVAGSIPTTGTSQLVDVEIEATGTSGSTIYLSNVCLYSNEGL